MVSFDFAHPLLLLLLLIIPLAAWGMISRRKKRPGLLFPATARTKDAARVHGGGGAGLFTQVFLRSLILILMIVALAGPRFGTETKDVESSGIDIMLGVDISGSMLGLDMSWEGKRATRLEAVKGVIDEFIQKRAGDRIGMIVFSGEPYLVSPLTLEHDWLRKNMDRIEVGSISPNQTSIGPPIGMATNRLSEDKDSKSRIVIMLTDGQDSPQPPVSPVRYAEAAAALGVKVYTIAVGTEGSVPRYLLGRDGKTIQKDMFGRAKTEYMNSSLDEPTLKEIATKGKGTFFRARDTKELQNIYDQIDKLEKSKIKLTYRTEYEDAWLLPLGGALALLLLELALSSTLLRTLP